MKVSMRAGISVALVLAAAAIGWHWTRPPPVAHHDSESAGAPYTDSRSAIAADGPPETAPDAAAERQVVAAVISPGDFAAQFRTATDYFAFVGSARPAAKAGDPQAQFFIHRALEYCRVEYPFYFRVRSRMLTLDEGLAQGATRWPFNAEYARHVHELCHGLQESGAVDSSVAAEWLVRAAAGGNPRAQVALIAHIWRESIDDNPKSSRPGHRVDPLRLAGTALRSRDPEVVMEIGDLIHVIRGEDVAEHESLAWNLAACERGADCGPQSLRSRWWCMNDGNRCHPSESFPEQMRRTLGSEFSIVELRARDINRLIDSGRWDELGFADTLEDVSTESAP